MNERTYQRTKRKANDVRHINILTKKLADESDIATI